MWHPALIRGATWCFPLCNITWCHIVFSADTTMRKKGRAMAQFKASQEEETPRTIVANFMEAHKVSESDARLIPSLTFNFRRRMLWTHQSYSHTGETLQMTLWEHPIPLGNLILGLDRWHGIRWESCTGVTPVEHCISLPYHTPSKRILFFKCILHSILWLCLVSLCVFQQG